MPGVFYVRLGDENQAIFLHIKNTKSSIAFQQASVMKYTNTHINRNLRDEKIMARMVIKSILKLFNIFFYHSFTGLGLNFFSNTPEIFKINSIKTLLHRAYTISSNFNFLNDEICHLKMYFPNNKYPMQIIENVINTFLSKKNVNKKSNYCSKIKEIY